MLPLPLGDHLGLVIETVLDADDGTLNVCVRVLGGLGRACVPDLAIGRHGGRGSPSGLEARGGRSGGLLNLFDGLGLLLDLDRLLFHLRCLLLYLRCLLLNLGRLQRLRGFQLLWSASTRMAGKATFILAGWTGLNVVV